MNYSMGSGIIRYIRASKTFSKSRAFRSSVRFEVPCTSKFRMLRNSVRFEVPCGHPFYLLLFSPEQQQTNRGVICLCLYLLYFS